MKEPRLFLDADGVLADFDRGAKDLLGMSAKQFIADYQKKFNVDRIPSAVSAAQDYDSMHLMAMAIQQAVTSSWTEPLEDDATLVVLAVD